MSDSLLPVIFTGFCTAVLLFVIVRAVPLMKSGKRPMVAVFFTFAMVGMVLSNLYWLAYGLLRPDTRMPFAANEIGEWAMFLLLSAALNSALGDRFGSAGREMLCAAAFTAASVALWIAWSGEWMQDVLTGVTFGWFLCTAARAIKLTDALSRRERRALGGTAALLIAAQAATFFVPASLKFPLELLGYALMLSGMALFLAKLLRAHRPDAGLALSAAGFAWSVSSMYMSEGYYYLAALASAMALLLFLLRAVRREVEAA